MNDQPSKPDDPVYYFPVEEPQQSADPGAEILPYADPSPQSGPVQLTRFESLIFGLMGRLLFAFVCLVMVASIGAIAYGAYWLYRNFIVH